MHPQADQLEVNAEHPNQKCRVQGNVKRKRMTAGLMLMFPLWNASRKHLQLSPSVLQLVP